MKSEHSFKGQRLRYQYTQVQVLGVNPMLVQAAGLTAGAGAWYISLGFLFFTSLAMYFGLERKLIFLSEKYRIAALLFFLSSFVFGALVFDFLKSSHLIFAIAIALILIDIVWGFYSWNVYKKLFFEENPDYQVDKYGR